MESEAETVDAEKTPKKKIRMNTTTSNIGNITGIIDRLSVIWLHITEITEITANIAEITAIIMDVYH